MSFARSIVLMFGTLAMSLFSSQASLAQGSGASDAPSALKPPETRRVELVEELHGVNVSDPYRWLEQDIRESTEVADWVKQQNAVTFGHLESLPDRESFRSRLTALWNHERFSSPRKAGRRYFFTRNNGLQNQSVLCVQDSLDAPERVLIDPNTWSTDGTIALSGLSYSEDGRYVAYGVQDAGSDWKTWRILDVNTGETLSDELRWIKSNTPAWNHTNDGLYYARFPEPEPGAKFQSLNLNQKVYFHKLGDAQSADPLVYERPDEPTWGFFCSVTEDGRYLFLIAWRGTDRRYRVFYRDLNEPAGPVTPLIDRFDHEFELLGNAGSTVYFKTDASAPKKRIIAIDLNRAAPEHWQTIVPEADEPMEDASYVGDRFVVHYLRDVQSRVVVFSRAGRRERDLELPGIGSAGGFGGRHDDVETFYSFSSFATPMQIYRLDVATGEQRLLRQARVDFDSTQYEVKQTFFPSRDGTRVPMFIVHRKGTKYDGSNPTLLYGYGGFNISITPAFSSSRVAWIERGGVFAVANLRGGGEYGEEWHQAGTKLRKQNVFDDFIAAAEHLVREKITSPAKLAIQGGSNGGLLVAACANQRPDLFAVALPAVGVMDMLRFHKFTAGRYWVDDFGSPDDPADFAALFAYSPYHNIKPGTRYPATLVTTADTDDRVVPGHSFKYAAALQAAQAGAAPVLIRIELRAGHGAGKPTSKLIQETADIYAFAWRHLQGNR